MNRRWLVLGALAFVACLVLGAAAAAGALAPVDMAVNDLASTYRHTPLGDLLRLLEPAGDPWISVALTLVATGAFAAAGRYAGAAWLGVSLLAGPAASVVKLVFALPRPPGADVLDIFGGPSHGFPSGHVVRFLVLVGVVAAALALDRAGRFRPGTRGRIGLSVVVVAGTAAMAAQRIVGGDHWFSDTVGGALFGAGWICLTLGLWPLAERPRRAAARSPGRGAQGSRG